MSKISIVVPVYNVEKVLSRCIESIINQSFKDIEVILINDGSTDESGKICDKYKSLDSRIIVVHKKNEGVSKARNIGINNASSEYIMFVDSDDYIKLDMCEKLFNAIEGTTYDIALAGYERKFSFNGKETKKILIKPDVISMDKFEQYVENWNKLFGKSLFNAPWGKLFKLEYIKKEKIYFDETLKCGEDLVFNLEVLRKTHKIAVINESLYVYECTERESLTTQYDFNKHSNDIFLFNYTLEYLKCLNMIEQCKQSVANIYLRSCFRTFEQMYYTKNELTYKDIKNKVIEIYNCDETIRAISFAGNRYSESILYKAILKCKNYHIIRCFTKARFIAKNIIRKGWIV